MALFPLPYRRGVRQKHTPSRIARLLENSPGVKILSKWILDARLYVLSIRDLGLLLSHIEVPSLVETPFRVIKTRLDLL
jgi:hypothetical protein